MTSEEVNAYMSLDKELAMCGVSQIDELFDDKGGDEGSEEDEHEC
jgi:hypothetical protein